MRSTIEFKKKYPNQHLCTKTLLEGTASTQLL